MQFSGFFLCSHPCFKSGPRTHLLPAPWKAALPLGLSHPQVSVSTGSKDKGFWTHPRALFVWKDGWLTKARQHASNVKSNIGEIVLKIH